jgi:hypothetical protein
MMEDATESSPSLERYKTVLHPMAVRKNTKKIKNNLLRLGKIRAADIIKQLSNGHALIYSYSLPKQSGICVYCESNDVPFRKPITTLCPACSTDGCLWVCENCFDIEHGVMESLE